MNPFGSFILRWLHRCLLLGLLLSGPVFAQTGDALPASGHPASASAHDSPAYVAQARKAIDDVLAKPEFDRTRIAKVPKWKESSADGTKASPRNETRHDAGNDSRSSPRNDSRSSPSDDSRSSPRDDSRSSPHDDSRSSPRDDSWSSPRNDSWSSPRNDSWSSPRNDSRSSPRNHSQGRSLEAGQLFAQSGQMILWLLVFVLIALLVIYSRRWLPFFGWRRSRADSLSSIQQIDSALESAEALPEDIATVAERYWKEGQKVKALSLLYRGTIELLTAHHRIDFPQGATEEEIRLLVGSAMPSFKEDFGNIARAWLRLAYAHRPPADIVGLLAGFNRLQQPGGAAS